LLIVDISDCRLSPQEGHPIVIQLSKINNQKFVPYTTHVATAASAVQAQAKASAPKAQSR
jgi:hypothetical protein